MKKDKSNLNGPFKRCIKLVMSKLKEILNVIKSTFENKHI